MAASFNKVILVGTLVRDPEIRYIGSGAAGRNTTILRSNYKTPEGARFYDASVKLYEGLGQ